MFAAEETTRELKCPLKLSAGVIQALSHPPSRVMIYINLPQNFYEMFLPLLQSVLKSCVLYVAHHEFKYVVLRAW